MDEIVSRQTLVSQRKRAYLVEQPMFRYHLCCSKTLTGAYVSYPHDPRYHHYFARLDDDLLEYQASYPLFQGSRILKENQYKAFYRGETIILESTPRW